MPIADIPSSFDHLVRTRLHRRKHVDAERFGRLQIDVELDFGGLLDRQVGGFFALENPAGIIAGQAVCLLIGSSGLGFRQEFKPLMPGVLMSDKIRMSDTPVASVMR